MTGTVVYVALLDLLKLEALICNTLCRHRPYHHDRLDNGFWHAMQSWDPRDGWIEAMDALRSWRGGAGYEAVRNWLVGQREAYAYLVLLKVSAMIDRDGLRKSRWQLQPNQPPGFNHPAFYIRAANGHSRPGPYCPESSFAEVPHPLVRGQGSPHFSFMVPNGSTLVSS